MSIERRAGKINRRGALSSLGHAVVTTGAIAAVTGGLIKGSELLKKPETQEAKHERPPREDFDTSEIAGERVGGLGEWYLDLKHGRIPEELSISFPSNLAKMWRAKLDRVEQNSSEGVQENVGDFASARAGEYAELWKKGPEAIGVPKLPEELLTKYPYFTHQVSEFSKVEREVLDPKNMDWSALAEAYGFSDWDVDMLGNLAGRAHGRSLMAYSMTEIMPYGEGNAAANIPFYDFMLKNAGPEFLLRIPAMSDELISYGPFQFTKFAIDQGIAAPHNRMSVDNYLPDNLQVPRTIENMGGTPDHPLSMRDHAAAALLFGLENVAIAVRALIESGAGQEGLVAFSDMEGATFASVLAMHHYRPAAARSALIDWARAVERGETGKPYYSYAPEEVAHYGKRSMANFKAIEAYFDKV